MLSIQARLGSGLLVSLLAVFLSLWLIVSNTIRDQAEEYIISRLEHDGETLLAAIEIGKDGSPVLDNQRLAMVYHQPFSGHYFQVISGESTIRSRSLWDWDLDVEKLAAGSRTESHTAGPRQQPLLLLIQGYRKQGMDLTIAVGEDLSEVNSNIETFQRRFALTAAALLLVLILLHSIMLKLGLLPLIKLGQELQGLERGELTELNSDVPNEVIPLVHEINHLLSVMHNRLQRSRNALGDLAHSLRKPLTLIMQLASDDDITHHRQTRQKLIGGIDRIQQVIARVLTRAKLVGEGPAGAYFSPDTDLSDLVDTLRSIYREREIAFKVGFGRDMLLSVDREDMLELLGNLLDNACKWAQHRVLITIEDTGSVTITIEDDGPGVAAEGLANIVRRGARLDESTHGYGLGLAICHDIVTHYGGTMDLGRSDLMGGFKVTVKLTGCSIIRPANGALSRN